MKHINKRITSLLLALVLLCGMMPMAAFAAEETEQTKENTWNGKSAVFVGDSITAGSGTTKIYYQFLKEAFGFESVTAMGVAGSCISTASDYGQDNQPLINRYQNIPSADLIVVFMGTNDYGHETPLGSATDTQDGTFYGALNTIIPALVAKHTYSKIVFVTPLHRYGFGTSKILGTQFTSDSIPNGVDATLGNYVDALKTVCANNGVSVIDLHTEFTLDPADATVRATYMPDGLHPNDAGHGLIAGIIEKHIQSYTPAEAPGAETEPEEETELVYGNKFSAGFSQQNRASSRINQYLKAGTVITLKDTATFQWACTKTDGENSNVNLGYFPDSAWSDKDTVVVEIDGWVGFVFKYRDEGQMFDLSKPLSDYITIEEPHTHVYENGICTGCGMKASPYLQQLPENILGCSNLYDSLTPVKGYYTATKYDTSNGAVLSVVIPVEPGDRIAASSFGPVSENVGSVNGIRVTYLLGDKIVTSLSAGDVYNGYTKNGYITVPDGVDAVCVPWWKPSDSNWLTLSQIRKDFAVHSPKTVSAQAPTCTEKGYTAGEICEVCDASLSEREEIPPTGHAYSGDACTICGAVNLEAILGGKYVSVLGDSISTFNGYSNDATANTTIGGNGPRYDAGAADTKLGSYCLLESVDQTWWMHFANRSGMKLLVNNSWAGSQVFGGKTSDGRVIPAAYLDRCVNLHDNTLENNPGNAPVYPDVIFVYLGINDYNFNRSKVGTGAVDYAGLISSDGTYVTPTTFGEAYGIMLHKMRNTYPDAQIFSMTLLPENLYSVDKTAWVQHNDYIRAAAEYYDIPLVDLAENCAITWENYSAYMIDKIHPTTAGMELISDCIETELLSYYKENPPHTHSYESIVTTPTCTEIGYTAYTCDCGDSYVTDYVTAAGHSYGNGVCSICGDMLAGKTISILGDSISTYSGVSNNTNYNSTIGSNKVYYSAGTQGVYQEDTWWQQALDVLGMELCVNNSWSGSAILGTRAGTVGAYLDRCVQLHNNNTGEEPDIIIVFMGTNDFSYTYDGGELGNYDLGLDDEIEYSTLIQGTEGGTFTYEVPVTSLEAYAIMLHKMQQRYPNAEIYCMSLMTRRHPVYSKEDVGQPTEFNAKLKEVIDTLGVNYIEMEGLFASDPADFDLYMGDKRVHPNKAGMDLMTKAVVSALMGEEADVCTVSYSLNGVQSNNAAASVLIGGRYDAILSAADTNFNISVTVTMDGEDLTASCYKNGKISISNVTGDIEIRAFVIKAPANYRWELNDGTLASTGDDENTLTLLTGSVLNGIQNSTQYALAENVVLKHDQPWIVEWNASGDWSGMLLTSTTKSATSGMKFIFRTFNTTGLLALGYYTGGQYNNFGIPLADLKLDMNQSHTYRMENRIADDSSNMVYLLVDGKEIGALNNYYIGGTKDQGITEDWVNGQDFTFGYIGSTSHPLKNMELQYLQIWESGHTHTYENGTCTGCGKAQPGPLIIQQPINAEVKLGERYCVRVEAEGEGLKYQWYLRNAGSKSFSKSSVKDDTYDDVMTEARANREVYCVITDANGNSVTTDTVKLICLPSEELEIVTQPTDGEAVLGERYCVTVEAKGEKLKYQWYFRNKGTSSWTKSSVTDNTYDDIMNSTRSGREVYCVITDRFGNKVTSDIVKLVCVPIQLEIISQPTDATASFGEMFCAAVMAKGEGLKYQWYFRNAGSDTWHKSGVRDNTYDDIMTKARANREIYCVITDKYGNSVITDIVKLIPVASVELELLEMTYEAAAMGDRYCVTVNAQGEGLTYKWYFRNAGSTRWSKSSVHDNTYDDVMNKSRANREVYCVITDACGNSLTTETVTLSLSPVN